MPLARIISHSLECSHELAASLEERGYAVEIVSPDAIPTHPADLELRVATSPDNVLTAKVQAHNGPRTASLDFVHYVNPPMPDFRLKAPEAIDLPPSKVALSPARGEVERVEGLLPGQAPEPVRLVPETPVVPAQATPRVAQLSPEPGLEPVGDQTPASALREQAPEPPRSWPKVKIVISRASPASGSSPDPPRKTRRIRRPTSWFLRVAATAAALLLAASLLSLGTMRPRGATTSNRQGSGLNTVAPRGQGSSGQALTAQPPANELQTDRTLTGDGGSGLSAQLNTPSDLATTAPAIDHSVVPAIEADKLKGKKTPSTAPGVSMASSVKRTSKPPRHQRTHRPDVVAPNTITYFNGLGAKPAVVKPLPRHPLRSGKRDSVVAARSVAALNAKAGPKAEPDK